MMDADGYNEEVTEYTITATAGANGSISPSGAVTVAAGGSQTFTITPSSGYEIDILKVDGLEVTVTTSYTFSDVNANHTIEVTFKQESQTPDPVEYYILDGADSNWKQNSDESLSIRGSGALSKFVGVKVDGTFVDAKNYNVKEGFTIITLKADYLNTLSVGTHTFEILWTDGSASTTFTIKADTSDNGGSNQNDNDNQNDNGNNNSNPDDSALPSTSDKKEEATKTGDNTPIVRLIALIIGSGLIAVGFWNKKKYIVEDESK